MIQIFLLNLGVLVLAAILVGSLLSHPACAAGEPFMSSLAATWEGEGLMRYRVAVQGFEGAGPDRLRIVAHNSDSGTISVVTPGAVVEGSRVILLLSEFSPGKIPLLEYTIATNVDTPENVSPVFAEITWEGRDGSFSARTESVAADDYVGGACSAIDKYARTPGLPEYYPAGKDLGVLKGSWYEMGLQYGQRSGSEIVDFFDYRFGLHVEKYGIPHLLEDIARYEAQAKLFFPEGLDFARGIGDGAEKHLSGSKYHADISNYMKIVFMNCDNCLYNGHPGPADADHGLPPHKIADLHEPVPGGADSCSMIALLGKKGATIDGTSMLVHNNDGDFIDESWRYTYICEPDTPGSNIFWSTTAPGKFFDIVGANNKGLALALTVGGNKTWIPSENIYERAFGVTWQYILLKALSSASSAQEVLELVTVGTPEYRAATGRNTLLRTRHNNYIIMDRDEAFVVEVTANRYAIRRPGDYGENDGFIVATNHFVADYSYDANNVRTDFPMTTFGDADYAAQSATRYNTAFWEGKLNYGKMDAEMMKKIWAAHYIINKEGERIELITDGEKWMPAHLASRSICSHEGGYPEKYEGSTIDTKIIHVDYNQIQFSLGRPCEWEGMYRTFVLPES